MVSPHSVVAFGFMRHEELQAETRQIQRAMACRPAHPGVVRRLRTWVGSAMIRLGTTLQSNARELGWDVVGSVS